MRSDQEHGRLTLSDRANHLIDLILNSERDTQNWIKFLLTIESAIAFGFGYLIKDQLPASAKTHWSMAALLSLLPVMGVATALIVGSIVHRSRKWHTWYVRKLNALPGLAGEFFASTPNAIHQLPTGFVGRRIYLLQGCIVIAWMAVVALIVWVKVS